MGASHDCTDCVTQPVMHCARCTTTRCKRHALGRGERCDRCEADWSDEASTRRAAKMIFAPPVAILTGGMLFGMITLGGLVGAGFVAVFALVSAFSAGAGACKVVDRSARAMFLRERAGGLPAARLLPSRR